MKNKFTIIERLKQDKEMLKEIETALAYILGRMALLTDDVDMIIKELDS